MLPLGDIQGSLETFMTFSTWGQMRGEGILVYSGQEARKLANILQCTEQTTPDTYY